MIQPDVFWDAAAQTENEEIKALLLTAGNQALELQRLLEVTDGLIKDIDKALLGVRGHMGTH